MSNFLTNLNNNLRLLLSMSPSDVVDVLVVSVAVFAVITFIRQTNAKRLALGLLILLAALGLSGILKLSLTNFILRQVFEIGVLAMVVLFQPEIRRALERMGSYFKETFNGTLDGATTERTIIETAYACEDMSKSRTGALIVFERSNRLNSINLEDAGCVLDAQVKKELLENLFYKGSPLHDGAVIIRDGRVAAARCILPTTTKTNLSGELGTRHRAAIGISERTDAVVIIVSEETGSISMAKDGQLKRHLSADMLEEVLRAELMPGGGKGEKGGFFSWLKGRKGTKDGKENWDQ